MYVSSILKCTGATKEFNLFRLMIQSQTTILLWDNKQLGVETLVCLLGWNHLNGMLVQHLLNLHIQTVYLLRGEVNFPRKYRLVWFLCQVYCILYPLIQSFTQGSVVMHSQFLWNKANLPAILCDVIATLWAI